MTTSGSSSGEVTSFDGTRLAVTMSGPAGAPPVVLVHGLGLSSGSWGRVPEGLHGEHRVIAYDLRAHGHSRDATGGDYSMKARALDLDAVLRRLVTSGERAVVVGNSLGGGIVLARAHYCGTAAIAGAVFAGSGGSGVTAPGLPARRLPNRLRVAVRMGWLNAVRAAALLGRHIRSVRAVSDWLIRRFAFTPHASQDVVEFVRDSFLSSRPKAVARTTLASLSHDVTRVAHELNVPTLVLHGSNDPEVPQQEVCELVSRCPMRSWSHCQAPVTCCP